MRASAAGVAWWYLRISGLLVITLVLGHLFVMHYANAPSATGSAFVAQRWTLAFWRDFDWLLLALALSHGLMGARNVIADAVQNRIGRRAADAVLGVFGALFLVVGTISIRSAASGMPMRGMLSDATWIVVALDALLGALAILTYLAAVSIAVGIGVRIALHLPLEWWQFHGQWAWSLHRVTGIGILAFLFVHILDLALLPLAPDLYDATVASYANPFLMPMEVALVCAVIYHALNGIRLWVLEFLDRDTTTASAGMLAGVLAATLALALPSVFVLVRHG